MEKQLKEQHEAEQAALQKQNADQPIEEEHDEQQKDIDTSRDCIHSTSTMTNVTANVTMAFQPGQSQETTLMASDHDEVYGGQSQQSIITNFNIA